MGLPESAQSEDEMPAPDLVLVGELNVDLILHEVEALPALGTERLASGMNLTLGSSSAILAANASALGTRTGFIGRVGTDVFGEFCLERLRWRRVDVRHVIETSELPTGLTAIYTHGGNRGMLTYPGAMTALTIRDIPWHYLERARHLHVSSYYLQSGLRPDCAELFRRAKSMGLTTSFDTNWDPSEQWGSEVFDVLRFVDIFLPNDEEARRITGESDLGGAMRALGMHAGTVVVTCGASGVRALRAHQEMALPPPAVEPIDAVGAGDSFNAGFLHKFLQGEPLETCLRFGLHAGSFSTLAAGGTGAFDDLNAFCRFLEQSSLSGEKRKPAAAAQGEEK